MKRQKGATAERAAAIEVALAAAYPDATCELDFRNPYELLVATILSAQCTDARVNMVTPTLFKRFPDATALAKAKPTVLEEMIRSTGFYRNKAKALTGMARTVVERHAGDIPPLMDDLTKLPGVGRKTANVVLGTALGLTTGVVVDTHVARLAKRLGLSAQGDPDKIEQELMKLFPASSWVALGHRLILHGRRVCRARKPDCAHCPLALLCPRIGV